VLGNWLGRRAAAALSRDASPGAVRLLAQAVATSANEALRQLALAALRQVTAQAGIDAVCAVWAATRDASLGELLSEQRWVAEAPAEARVLTALKARRLAVVEAGEAGLVAPLAQACADPDEQIAQSARECLGKLQNPAAIDTLCALWLKTRAPLLSQALLQGNCVAREPAEVRVFSALHSGRSDLASAGGPEIVEPLLRACADADEHLAARAKPALGQLQSAEARDALCRVALESDHPLARQVALACGYAPKDARQRALFFFLTEQWDKYETLDFDHSLLGAVYESSEPKLRGRLAEKARRAGRTEWVSLVSANRQDRRLGELTDEEWETAYAVLLESQRWSELWQLAQLAPPGWGVRFLERLASTGWQPDAAGQREGFAALSQLACQCAHRAGQPESQAPGQGAAFSPSSVTRLRPEALGRLVRCQARLEGHQGPIGCVAVTNDNQIIASGGQDTTVRLWSAATGAPLHVCAGHKDWVTCLALSADGRWLASSGPDGRVCLWAVSERKLAALLTGHEGAVRCLAFTPEGQQLLSGGEDRRVRLWDASAGRLLTVLDGHVDAIGCVAVSPQGQWAASGSYDNNARLWRLPEGQPEATLRGHKGLVNCLAFSPGGELLATGSKDRTIMLWNVPEGNQLVRLKGHKDDVICLAISPNGRLLATGSWDNTVRLWRLPEGAPLEVLGSTGTMDGHTGWITCLAFSPDGAVLATGSVDNTVRLWSIPEGKPIISLSGHEDRVSCVAMTTDGGTVVSGSWDGTLRLWQSELDRLFRLPAAQATLNDLEWAQDALGDSGLSEAERSALALVKELLRWRRRYDIGLEEKAPISVGEFDIEIEG
jgi:WD40 repeat protein